MEEEQVGREFIKEKNFIGGKTKNWRGKMLKAFQNAAATFENEEGLIFILKEGLIFI